MNRTTLVLGGLTLAASLATGCNNGPPGGGLTNGTPPDLSAQKPAMRTDMPEANRTNTGEMHGAAGTEGSESAGTATNPIVAPAPAPAATDSKPDAAGKATGKAPKDSGSATGATKPSGDIKAGTPKSPQ